MHDGHTMTLACDYYPRGYLISKTANFSPHYPLIIVKFHNNNNMYHNYPSNEFNFQINYNYRPFILSLSIPFSSNRQGKSALWTLYNSVSRYIIHLVTCQT